jgi:hypothetical protein
LGDDLTAKDHGALFIFLLSPLHQPDSPPASTAALGQSDPSLSMDSGFQSLERHPKFRGLIVGSMPFNMVPYRTICRFGNSVKEERRKIQETDSCTKAKV